MSKLSPNKPYRITPDSLKLSCYDLAHYLLGKLLVRKVQCGDTTITLKGRIVETECYLGGEDKASHSHNNKITPRNEPMFMPEGTSYVYMTYGMYYCFNISSIEPGAAVLIRALEPMEGITYMKKVRPVAKSIKDLCNGPSKLCISMDIKKDNCNKLNLYTSSSFWLEVDPNFDDDFTVVSTTRIGIDKVDKEWALKPLRFYIFGNKYVSKRDKKAEENINKNV